MGEHNVRASASDELRRLLEGARGEVFFLDLEERLEGTLLSRFVEEGYASAVVEGGQHDLPSAVLKLSAAVWPFLLAGGWRSRPVLERLDCTHCCHACPVFAVSRGPLMDCGWMRVPRVWCSRRCACSATASACRGLGWRRGSFYDPSVAGSEADL